MGSLAHPRRLLFLGLLALALGIPAPAAAQTGTCFDPVPNPSAAGWTVEENGGSDVQEGTPLRLIDAFALPGSFVNVRCEADVLFGGEITLSPHFSIDAGYGKNPGDDSLGIHVTINDGIKMIRAVVLENGAVGAFKVALVSPLTQSGYSPGIPFVGNTADFTLRRLADGTAVLSAQGHEEQQPLVQQPDSDRPLVQTIEFGTLNVPARTTTNWDTLGLPAVATCQNPKVHKKDPDKNKCKDKPSPP